MEYYAAIINDIIKINKTQIKCVLYIMYIITYNVYSKKITSKYKSGYL